jgi:hypothetical protein
LKKIPTKIKLNPSSPFYKEFYSIRNSSVLYRLRDLFGLINMRVQPDLPGNKLVKDIQILITEEEANDFFSCMHNLNFEIKEKNNPGMHKSFPFRKDNFHSNVIWIEDPTALSNLFSIFVDIKPQLEYTFVQDFNSCHYIRIDNQLFHSLMLDDKKRKEYREENFENGCVFVTCEMSVGMKAGRYGRFVIKYTSTPPLLGGYLQFLFYFEITGSKYSCSVPGKSIEKDYDEEELSKFYEKATIDDVYNSYTNTQLERYFDSGIYVEELLRHLNQQRRMRAIEKMVHLEKSKGNIIVLQLL